MPANAGIFWAVARDTSVSGRGAQEDARVRGHDG